MRSYDLETKSRMCPVSRILPILWFTDTGRRTVKPTEAWMKTTELIGKSIIWNTKEPRANVHFFGRRMKSKTIFWQDHSRLEDARECVNIRFFFFQFFLSIRVNPIRDIALLSFGKTLALARPSFNIKSATLLKQPRRKDVLLISTRLGRYARHFEIL